MKVFNEILDKHTKMYNCKRESYMINDYMEILITQNENKVIMWGVNHKTDRFLNLSTKKFKKLMDGFKSASTDLYSNGNSYYITIGKPSSESVVEVKSSDLEIEELRKKVDYLHAVIDRLEKDNKKLLSEVDKYKKDIEELNKNTLIHNSRGAGRKSKFTDVQVDEIKRLRVDGYTIKDIANRYNCSVGLIHKLINEK